MAIAKTSTLLSLDRYAKIMGINPLHFNQAIATGTSGVEILPNSSSPCTGIWYQHAWQTGDGIGREELAQEIATAERDIADFLGYYPAPKYIAQEIHLYPSSNRRDVVGTGIDVVGRLKSVTCEYGKFVLAGRREVTLVGSPSVVYTDDDSDGFYETATVTIATTETDECELKVYFTGHSGDETYEIRNYKSKALSGGTLTVVFDSWQLIDPSLWETFPTSNDLDTKVEITDTSKFVVTVDVYREYTDTTQDSVNFYWEGETNLLTTQGGVLHPRSVDLGVVVPSPATYNATTEVWDANDWTKSQEPDFLKIWYLAGEYSNEYRRVTTCDPLSDYWATTIAWLATARLGGRMCDCDSAYGRFAKELQTDVLDTNTGLSYVGVDVTTNPFGTRLGELRAWRRVDGFGRKSMKGFAV